jgi:hypothetical protein
MWKCKEEVLSEDPEGVKQVIAPGETRGNEGMDHTLTTLKGLNKCGNNKLNISFYTS